MSGRPRSNLNDIPVRAKLKSNIHCHKGMYGCGKATYTVSKFIKSGYIFNRTIVKKILCQPFFDL